MPPAEIDRIRSALADRYDVLDELGRGGMATVYRARDPKLGREVAVKVLQAEVAGSVGAERFLAEIRAAAGLAHPNILPLHDSGEHEGFLWYAMPCITGDSLSERIERDGPLSVDEALRITCEIADALSHAHARGFVHRDVKPSNILLTEGHALLCDFGIARALDQQGGKGLTRTGFTVGTPAFMSPEQSGSGKVDGRADQYSLACVLYEMLVGDPPFTGPTAQVVMARHALEEVPSVRVARPAVPVEVERAIERALAKTPADRFRSMDGFRRALEPPPGGWTTEGSGRRIAGRVRPLRLKIAAGLTALFLASGVAAVVFLPGDRSETAPGPSLDPRRVAVGLLDNATGDPSLDHIGRIGADWLNEGLHRSGVVDVVPTLSAMQADRFVRQKAEEGEMGDPVRAFAEETGAGVVVSGRYYVMNDSLEFHVEITDANQSMVLARTQFRSSRSDPRSAIGDLRERVMGALALSFDDRMASEVRGRRPPRYAAYAAFDQGMEHYMGSEWADATEPLKRAHQLDSTFVVPLLYAAASHYNVDQWSPVHLGAADSLLAIADRQRDALSEYDQHWLDYLRARIQGDNEQALRAIRRAAEIAPRAKASYNRAYAAQLTNRPQEAVEALGNLDPDRGPMRGWFPYWQMLTDNLHRLGRHEDELEAARAARQRHPDRIWSMVMLGQAHAALGQPAEILELLDGIGGHSYHDALPGNAMLAISMELRLHGHEEAADRVVARALEWFDSQPETTAATAEFQVARAGALHTAGRAEEALAIVDSVAAAHPEQPLRAYQGILAATIGDEVRARAIDEELEAIERSYPTGVEALNRARIAALLGEDDRAVQLLRQAYQEGYRPLRHPDLNLMSLRGQPSYQQLHRPRG